MSGKRKPKKASSPEVAYRDGQQAVESLPFPLVYYPGHYGTFFAFSTLGDPTNLRLCSCSRSAVECYLRLSNHGSPNALPQRQATLDSYHFPWQITMRALDASAVWNVLEFEDGICHRCNMVRPSMDYCHPMYGGQFMRGFGWYVNQAFYRLGVDPRSRWTGTAANPVHLGHPALDDICPQELRDLLTQEQKVTVECRAEMDRLLELVSGSRRDDIAPDEITYWTNVKIEEAIDYIRLRREAAQAERAVTTYVENLVRQEFGFRKVGEGWVSETLLAALVSRLLPEHEVLRHHRPVWLEGLELDMYVPSLRLGIEYQGQQHFHAVEAWGGEMALAELQKRDLKKARLCRAVGVTLVLVDYTEPLTEDHVAAVLGSATAAGIRLTSVSI